MEVVYCVSVLKYEDGMSLNSDEFVKIEIDTYY